jgi:hypothetical protein
MSGADYYNCDLCGKGKIFYDARIDWESYGEYIGQIRVICKSCFDSGNRIVVIKNAKEKKIDLVHNSSVHRYVADGFKFGKEN